MTLFVIWLVLVVAFSVTGQLLRLTITDQVERDLPLDQRPSWNLRWNQACVDVIKSQAKMHPTSRLRAAYRLSFAGLAVLLSGPFTLAFLRSCTRGG